jgi:hypothetical protein
MAKASPRSHKPAPTKGRERFVRGGGGEALSVREASAGRFAGLSGRVHAVIEAAESAGLMQEKTDRIGGRVSPRLIAEAKKRTGIQTDSDLIAFALANVALQDDFAEAFRKARGTVDAELDLGF